MKFEPIKYAVPQLLPMGLIILAGKQKIGKSWLDLNLAIAIASGGIALSKWKCEKGDVLYMALEDNQRRIQDRLRTLIPSGNVPKSLYITLEWPVLNADGLTMLDNWIKDHPGTRLIIIDPFVCVRPPVTAKAGQTGYDADYMALKGIKHLADKYNICILVQVHKSKPKGKDSDPFDEVNGTTGITACADGFINLTRARGAADATLYASGRDYAEELNLPLKFDKGNWIALNGDHRYHSLNRERKEIVDTLSQSEKPLTPAEIALILKLSPGTIRGRLKDMVESGEVKDTGKGYISLIHSPNSSNNNNNGNSPHTANSSNASNTYQQAPLPMYERF
jgi:RecA-family ATPase